MTVPFCGRRTERHGAAGFLPGGKAKLSSTCGRALPPFLPGVDPAPVPPPTAKGAAMNDHVTRAVAAAEELAAELTHADRLIAEQQARIKQLERQVCLLQSRLKAAEAA